MSPLPKDCRFSPARPPARRPGRDRSARIRLEVMREVLLDSNKEVGNNNNR